MLELTIVKEAAAVSAVVVSSIGTVIYDLLVIAAVIIISRVSVVGLVVKDFHESEWVKGGSGVDW